MSPLPWHWFAILVLGVWMAFLTYDQWSQTYVLNQHTEIFYEMLDAFKGED